MAKIHYDSYSFQPIAFVRTAARYRYEEPRQSVFSPTPAQLEFTADPRFRDALADLDGFDRLWVVAVFHLNVNPDRTANWNPKVRPPVTPDDKKYGVFSTRSPHRPNPIALSCVEVEKIDAAKGIIHLRACDLLDGYKGVYCLESFDPRCIQWLYKNRPELIRGQLAENYFRSTKAKLPWYLKLVLANHMMNFLSKPDFVAFRYSDRKELGTQICRKFWGLQGVTWTIKSQADYDTAVKEGWIPIFEGFRP